MSVVILSTVAVLITFVLKSWAHLAVLKTAVLFLGLEGTVLLASAISPPLDIERPPKGLKKLTWWFAEGGRLNYPMRYNPVCFYLGLLFMAASIMFSVF